MTVKLWLYVGAFMAVVFTGWFAVTKLLEIGYERCNTERSQEISKMQQQLTAERKRHRAELDSLAERANSAAAKDRSRLAKLLAENQDLARWWSTAVPPAAVDYIFGLQSTGGPNPVQPGAEPAQADPAGRT